MKKLYYFMSVASIALGLASCNKGESTLTPELPTGHQVTFVANTESNVDTKTYLSGNDKSGYWVLWSEGDKIILDNPASSRFYLLSGAGTTKGTFHGYGMGEGTFDAYYTTASTINWLSDETEYIPGNVISSAPMKGTLTFEGGYISSEAEFKNLCGLLRLSLKGDGTVRQIRVYADQYLYGTFDVNEEGSAVIKYQPEHDYVTHNCEEGVNLASDKGSDFYIPLPPNNYTGVKIEIIDFLGKKCTKTLKDGKVLNIARAMITPVSLNVTGLTDKGILPGRFFVGTTKLVYFSKGNLYWDGDSFEFEENQYDCLPGWSSTHVDHFSWNKDAAEAYARISSGGTLSSDVLFTNDPDYEQYPNTDFTVGGVKGKYRTLTQKEWEYLFKNNPHKWTKVHDVNGLVIAPIEHRGTLLDSYADNDALAAENLVFLPAAGSYPNNNGESSGLFNTCCYYWSSSAFSDGFGYFTRCDAQYLYSDVHYSSTNKFSIRLVKDE